MSREPCYQANDVEVLPDRRIAISWEDGRQSFFHFVWLRQQHFHPAFGRPDQGENDVRLPDDPEVLSVRDCRIADDHLIVDWLNDGVQTRHEMGWLHDNAYDRDLRQARKFKPHTWTREDASTSAWFEWNEVLEDESRLWKLYTTMRDYGFARVRTAPVEAGAIVALAEKFGPIRVTDFGSVFDIASRPLDADDREANIGATASNCLGPHTDEGWRYAPPGISFHLCLESTPAAGGTSILCDGFLAAERLRESDPDVFHLLTHVPLRFAAQRNPKECYYAYSRVISVDIDGDITGIRFSDRTLGVQDLPEDLIEPAYQAIRAFAKELYQPDLAYQHDLRPGECNVFDNHRVLHARTAFEPDAGPRRIQQCAVDREEFHNRLRILANKLGHTADAKMILPTGALG